eukprot:4296820-Pyramimonas_sp.AAC.1
MGEVRVREVPLYLDEHSLEDAAKVSLSELVTDFEIGNLKVLAESLVEGIGNEEVEIPTLQGSEYIAAKSNDCWSTQSALARARLTRTPGFSTNV